ncbi:CPBP family intramembrane glutamic endopeptidase [Lacinutrix jangbogonensis]|uniref:CPBP family intramembrane glutamic endopeptidase n=1 Tax=Lacinutrix jangbogonensis TaxID=1469557 RepID=UPI00053D3123|nr:CPBP family intramembrane glutamic endopeptidase [Lacinutrix jangbogonensis]
MKVKSYSSLGIIVLLTISLVVISNALNGVVLFENFSWQINKHIAYQAITLFISFFLLLFLRRFKKNEFLTYFKKGNVSAKIYPVPIVGIKPKAHENWSHTGKNLAIVITLVTAVVIYFQVIKGSQIEITTVLKILPFSILFALTNSFVEEIITRFGVVVSLKNILPDKYISIISGLIFGTVHFWGNPGGIVGLLVAGFLGWFLAKSILETKGIFWAWFIHFLQDVIIITALLSI